MNEYTLRFRSRIENWKGKSETEAIEDAIHAENALGYDANHYDSTATESGGWVIELSCVGVVTGSDAEWAFAKVRQEHNWWGAVVTGLEVVGWIPCAEEPGEDV